MGYELSEESRDQIRRLRPDMYIVSLPSLEAFADEHRLIRTVAEFLYKDIVTWYSHFESRARHVPVVRVNAEDVGVNGLLGGRLVELIRS